MADWERRDVCGELDDVVAHALLTEAPGSFIVITENDDPEAPGEKLIIVVPEWGIA